MSLSSKKTEAESKRTPNGPLAGVRVLDLTAVIMGPFATHILADLGADVIKIEAPEGDSFREYKPARHAGMNGGFLNLNRNKRSVCLDLKTEECREALAILVRKADVLIHNMRPAIAERLACTYERIAALNPEIIYCTAVGFGSEGPYRDKPAYDDLIEAGSGLASLYEKVYGTPAYVPTVLCDKLAGQAIAYAVVAALYQRACGGGGQAIEVPMFETAIEFNLVEHMAGFAFDPPLGPAGFARIMNPERKPFRTKDGFACILPYSDKNWRDFYTFTGRQEFLSDVRFNRLSDRVMNIAVLYKMVEEEAAKRTTAEWVEFCDGVGIPCMPVLTLEDLAQDQHVKAVGLFGVSEHPSEGRYRTVRRPVLFSKSSFAITRHAPRQGEHTEAVLKEAGISPEKIDRILQIAKPAYESVPGD